jgi:uncharacterized protein (TIGR02246 family)
MAAKPTPVPALDPEQAIRALAKEFQTHYNARDIEKLLALFTDDGRLLVPHRDAAQGRAALRSAMQEGFNQYDPRNTVIEPTHVEYAGDVAFSIGHHTNNVRLPDGTRIDDRSKWVTTLRREFGKWKLVALIYNTDLPVPGR